MRSHRHDVDEGGARRPKADPTESESAGLMYRAAAARRTDVLGAAGLLGLQRSVGNTGVAGVVDEGRSTARDVVGSGDGTSTAAPIGGRVAGQADAGPQPLDDSTRARLERQYRSELSAVRVHLDGQATSRASAVAFTIGRDVVLDPGHYRPGTVVGDAVLAHEVAHVVQQTGDSGGGSQEALEVDADRAAAGAVTAQATTEGFFPRLRAALSLQRCKGCTDRERTLLEQLRDETDPSRLEPMLRNATDDQLTRARGAVSAGSVHADAIAWEQAIRARDFRRLVELHASSDARFRVAYASRILDAIMGGRTTIHVDTTNADFVDLVRVSFDQLLHLESGFRLIVELLATAKPVTLQPGADQTTSPADPQAARTATLPGGQPGGSGSTVTLNPALARNQVVLGGEAARMTIVPQDPAVTVGHELIHALNNARGQNIAPALPPEFLRTAVSGAGLVRDPITGEPQSPEELRTITGQTSFSRVGPRGAPGGPVSYPAGAGITENDLRRDLGLPTRLAHFGATGAVTIPRRGAATVDDLVARYRVNNAPVSPAAVAAIRTMLVGQGLDRLMPLAADAGLAQISVPHGAHVLMHIRFVERNATLADALEGLTVQ